MLGDDQLMGASYPGRQVKSGNLMWSKLSLVMGTTQLPQLFRIDHSESLSLPYMYKTMTHWSVVCPAIGQANTAICYRSIMLVLLFSECLLGVGVFKVNFFLCDLCDVQFVFSNI
jgi:hypothetical protein